MAIDVSAIHANDWQWTDGVETVTLQPQNPEQTTITGVKVIRDEKTTERITAGEFGIDNDTMALFAWDSTCDGIVPRNGDKFTDASNETWTLASVRKRTIEPRWSWICSKDRTT